MNLVGCMCVRNEDWCLGLSARVALMWCDRIVILNHASTDGTGDIPQALCEEFPDRVTIMTAIDTEWREMEHRQMMLRSARYSGATHIAIIDADEILTGNLLGTIRGHVEAAGANMLMLPGYNLRGGLHRYHSNGIWGNRWFSTAFKDDPRANWSGDKFHSREPGGITWGHVKPVKQGEGGILHLWGASERRLRAKHVLYKVTERLRWPGTPVAEIDRMYSWAIKGDLANGYGTPDTWTYADVPVAWWPTDLMYRGRLFLDSEPWQEAEVRHLVAEHGRERFSGLDLFGVA